MCAPVPETEPYQGGLGLSGARKSRLRSRDPGRVTVPIARTLYPDVGPDGGRWLPRRRNEAEIGGDIFLECTVRHRRRASQAQSIPLPRSTQATSSNLQRQYRAGRDCPLPFFHRRRHALTSHKTLAERFLREQLASEKLAQPVPWEVHLNRAG